MIQLRPYQTAAIQAVQADWHTYSDVLVVMATGLGKTAVACALIDDMARAKPDARFLFMAHRQELIEQPRDRMLSYFPAWQGRIGIVMADNNGCDKPLTIATVQTLSSARRLTELLASGPIDYLISDECFPAGTLVDGKPIESIEIGDTVTAYNEQTGTFENRIVTRTSARPVQNRLIRLSFCGHTLTCTPNHPILVNGKWTSAECVQSGDSMIQCVIESEDCTNGKDQSKNMRRVWQDVSAAQLEQPDDAHVLTGMQSSATRRAPQARRNAMHRMRKASDAFGEKWSEYGPQGQSVLLRSLQEGLHQQAFVRAYGPHESPVCAGAHDSQESDARSGCQSEDANQTQGARLGQRGTRRQRKNYGAPKTVGVCAWLADGSSNTHRNAAWQWLSDRIQGGHRQCDPQDCRRSRRQFAQDDSTNGRGCEKRRSAHIVRVDSVEVLERSNQELFCRVCPDGFVYNLEIDGLHTYIANGIVVHNCHHAPSDTYVNVYQTLRDCNPNLKHLGVTATPLRSDGAGLAQVFQHVAFKMGIREGVSQGWLVPPRWLAIQTGISLAGLPSHNGDYTQKRLADVYETANCFELVVKSHKEYAADRRALAFTSSVAGAHELARHFNEAGIKAAAADGTTAKQERANILSAFRRGELQVLVNMGIYTEGLDVPEVSCIHQVRPTKSDALYTQILGRALRIVPGKEDALILDYAPIEARNIIMAGDVLGVDAKKEAYVKETKEPGEVIGGFTFDGSVKWLNGSPMELISRQLDYLHASPWVWDHGTGERDWLILPLGKAGDEIERTLAMSPVSDDMALYLIAKRPEEPVKAYRVKDGTFEELATWAEDYASKRGQAIIAAKARQWRKQPPSDAQIKFAGRLRVYKPGMSKGDCANAITRALTLRALAAAGFIN